MPDLYPLRFQPVYKHYLWGGRRFETALDRELAPDGNYAESWEIADHPEGERASLLQGPLPASRSGNCAFLTGKRCSENTTHRTSFPCS